MFAACAVAIFCLVSVSHSTPLVCEKLVHPLQSVAPLDLEGRWTLVAGSLNHRPWMDGLRLTDSITMYFSNTSDPSTVFYTQINRFGDQCHQFHYNISVDGSSFSFDVGNHFKITGSLRYTSCPDCLVVLWVVKSRQRHSLDLYLLSRRREVEQKEMEEFRAQLNCYQLPVPVVMDPTAKLCPEQPQC